MSNLCLTTQLDGVQREFIVMRVFPPVPPEYPYLLGRDMAFREHAIQSMTGTSGRQRVQVDALAPYLLPFPPADVWAKFGSLVGPTFADIQTTRKESVTLAALRDGLLPGLVSGEKPVGRDVILKGDGIRSEHMTAKRAFISFDYDNDDDLRNALVGQAKYPNSPFDIVDASVRRHLSGNWKKKVRNRIRRADHVIVMCGEHTHKAEGVAAEVKLAQEEDKPYFLLRGHSDGVCTKPTTARSE